MIGIYVICFIVFPISIFIQAKRCDDKKVLLEKDDTNVIKGFAICLVIFTHLIIELKTEVVISPLLNIFQVTGAVGVLLFFFVSGYGIYKQYNKSFSGKNFWFKRLFNMYLPCIFMQFIFCMIKMLMQGEFSFLRLFIESFFYGWFIDVILIQYFVFYISLMISRSVGGGRIYKIY